MFWLLDGTSPVFSVPGERNGFLNKITLETRMRLDSLISSLRKDTIALFTPEDIIRTQDVQLLPSRYRDDKKVLNMLVAKNACNGIILLPTS
jgi:hypothetical protein